MSPRPGVKLSSNPTRRLAPRAIPSLRRSIRQTPSLGANCPVQKLRLRPKFKPRTRFTAQCVSYHSPFLVFINPRVPFNQEQLEFLPSSDMDRNSADFQALLNLTSLVHALDLNVCCISEKVGPRTGLLKGFPAILCILITHPKVQSTILVGK